MYKDVGMEQTTQTAESIRREIIETAQAEIREILESAEKEAKRILEEAKVEIEKIQREVKKKSLAQAEILRKRILSGLHLEVQRIHLQTTEETVSKIFEKVLERLETFRKTPSYEAFLDRMVLEGIMALDTQEVHIVAGEIEKTLLSSNRLRILEKKAESLGKKVQLKLLPETLSEGGVVLRSSDQRQLFDNRFSSRIRRFRDRLYQETMKKLAFF